MDKDNTAIRRAPIPLIGDLVYNDFIGKCAPLFSRGYYIRDTDGKITCQVRVEVDTPWIHVRTDPTHYCKLWHDIFNYFGFIPSPCINCWKVVARPRTLEQQFELLQIMEEDLEGPCKIGIEKRKYVRGHYGAYFYNKSQFEGRKKYMEVYRAMKSNAILSLLMDEVDEKGATTRLILKRFCTEFELSAGPSNAYRPPPNAAMWEKRSNEVFDLPIMGVSQPDDLKNSIKREWIEFAWDRDDPTVTLYNHGEPLYTPVVTYHTAVKGEVV